MSSGSWAQLHPDLIEAIANHLTSYTDYIRFRAICVSWRSAVPKFPNHHLPLQIPWLMLNSDENYGRFFSFSKNNKYHSIELPECSGKRICGSSLGWLLLMENGPEMNIFNPITKTLIQLPPITTFPHVEFQPSVVGQEVTIFGPTGEEFTQSLFDMQNYFIKKMILSSSPSKKKNKKQEEEEDDDYMVVVILCLKQMAFMKKGDQVWTLMTIPDFEFEDVIFHKGQCFALDSKRRTSVCGFDGSSPHLTVISIGPQGEMGSTEYLVDCSGDLLLVSRIIEHTDIFEYSTVKFRIFKFNQSGKRCQWNRVKDLNDHVLFLGANSSVSLLAHEFSGCQRNCIYFTDDYQDWPDSYKLGGRDLGVFDINDGSIKPLGLVNTRLLWPPPTWVTPNPN